MHPLEKRTQELIRAKSLLGAESTVVIGVSGGPDSISLLHILSRLFPEKRRIAVYIDHGLRPHETEAEKALVAHQAMLCGAIFKSISVDVQGAQIKEGISLEEAARILRYQALEAVRSPFPSGIIAVGHTADDQAEEILLRLIRGSGSTGLSGMKLRNGAIIRPLLHEKKDTLLLYLKEQDLVSCQDSSNLETRFLRNKIRLSLLPFLENNFNTSVRQTLLQTAEILDAEDQLLAELTLLAYQKLVHMRPQGLHLALPGFTLEPLAIQRRILEKACWTMDAKPSFKKIEALLGLLHSSGHKELHLGYGLRATKERDGLLFHRPFQAKGYRGPGFIPRSFPEMIIACPGRYPVPELNMELLIERRPQSPCEALDQGKTLQVDAATIQFPLLLRSAQPGERFHPLGAPGSKKIARFLSDHKIPASERDEAPILLTGKNILAIIGHQIGNQFRIGNNTNQVLLLHWLPMGLQ